MSETIRRERSRIVVITVLITLVVALAATLVSRGWDHRPRAEVGEVLLGPLDADGGAQPTEVLLPWARLEVAIAEPVEELPQPNADGPSPLRPPPGGSFIRVDVKPADDTATSFVAMDTPFVSSADVVLRVGGEEYPLTPRSLDLSPMSTVFGGSAWVAVDGQPDDASLAITVAGETEVIADGEVSPSRMDELADLPTSGEIASMPATKCGRPQATVPEGLRLHRLRKVSCLHEQSIRTPYVDGLGWAEEGREFLVVHLATNTNWLFATSDDTTAWRERNQRVEVTLDGAPSLGEVNVNSLATRGTVQDVHDPMQYVFDVPRDTAADDLEIAVRFDAEPADPFVNDSRPVTLQWRIPSGDPAGDPR